VESALASAQRGARELIMVVDGVDDASCGEAALLSRLARAMKQVSNVRLITLGSEKPAVGAGCARIQMDEELVFDDIMAVIRSALDSNSEFSSMPEFEKESIITRLTETSAGSFLRARLITGRLSRETGHNKFRRAVDTIIETRPTVTNLCLQNMQGPDMTSDAKLMLAWLTIAERPLSPRELEALASIQPGKSTMLDKRIDVMAALAPVQDLVFFHDGLVYIRHGLIRTSLRELLPQLLPAGEDPHAELTARLMLYIKTVVREQHEPSVTPLDSHDTGRLLSKHPLLHFAVRYWPIHFTKTDVFAHEKDSGAARAFAHVYPDSVTAALLLASLWEHMPKPVLLAYQTIVANIHRELFKTRSVLTLQSIIFLAILHQQVDDLDEAAPLLFEAASISEALLGPSHNLTVEMACSYIQVTELKVTSSTTDVMTKRGQVLGILLECYKTQFGPTSTQVVAVLRQLVEHHRALGEDKKVQQINEQIQAITSKKPDESVDHDLRVELQSPTLHAPRGDGEALRLDVEVRDDPIKGAETVSFALALDEAEKAAAAARFEQAERLYLELLQRVGHEHRSHNADIWAETGLRALLSFSKFLHTQKRTTEASAILVSGWAEYSRSASSLASENSAALLTQVAQMMRSVGLSSVALSVFKHCAEYYRVTNRTKTSAYEALQKSLQVTAQEVQQSVISSDVMTVSETTLEEMVIESMGTLSTVSQTTLSTTTRLASLYVSQHRWHDATRFIKKTLRGMWSSLFSVNVQDVALVDRHAETCVELASRLAECYRARRRLAQEDDIRVRVYCALRSSRPVSDKMRQAATRDLLAFYRRTSQHEPAIVVRQEMLDDYTAHYGDRHPTVIETLRELAESTRPRPVFIEYYKRIVHALTTDKDSGTSSPEALEPVTIVATELWSRGLFSDALPYYAMLFATFLAAPNTSPRFRDEGWVRECFGRYTDCLRSVRSPLTVLRRITTEFQAQCMHIYGDTAPVTIHATIALATICQESKVSEPQAIKLYEKLLQIQSDEIDRQEISANLEMLHELQAADSMSVLDMVDASSSQVSHAVTVLRKHITWIRERHGWAHQESLSKLTELVRIYNSHGEAETATRELRETAAKVLSTETSSTRLMTAASTIASCYITINQVQKVTELAEDVYRQIVMKDRATTEQGAVDLSACGREGLVFLAQLEQSLRRSSATLVEILAALTTQYVYFGEFRALIAPESTASFMEVLVASARLHHHLIGCDRQGAADYVFERFSRWFRETEAKRLNLSTALSPGQTKLFLQSLLDHFGTHKSQDVVRSVGIMGNARAQQLRDSGRFQEACDLALACFHYIAFHKDAYHTLTMTKLVLGMGMAVVGPERPSPGSAEPDEATRKLLLKTSRTILHDVLHVLLDDMKINLATLDLAHLGWLILLVGQQEDWPTLSSLLTSLWRSHEAQRDWPPAVTLALGRRYILSQWVVGDSMTAIRTAEHIVYNCRRVHGPLHPATLDMSVLLGQLYTGLAQRYQKGQAQQPAQHHYGRKGSERVGATEMANRYYKKAAALHENILRAFTDPVYASMDAGGPLMHDMAPTSPGAEDANVLYPPGSPLHPVATPQEQQQQHQVQAAAAAPLVARHFRLLKLAVQRLGAWPREHGEYERLSADVMREFGAELRREGITGGVETWEVGGPGKGRAIEGEEDSVPREEELNGGWLVGGDLCGSEWSGL
jgi:hypothetical protein